MPRTREFDTDQALGQAMHVFWRKGFADTSIDDLVKATGVSRYGLYGEFGNKRGLFQAALSFYNENIVGEIFDQVEEDDASLPQVQQYFSTLAVLSPTAAGRNGCLMCNTITEEAAWDKKCIVQIKGFQRRVRSGFEKALGRARDKGEIEAQANPAEMANFLLGIAVAVSTLSRQPVDKDMVANLIDSAMKRLA
ncbi:MAG: TetR family transcriptional regulator [Candidatus Latescibacteria bacterium]|nr:TetR family transcriptional regulator [Candidatus Latescibacterota bacterium]